MKRFLSVPAYIVAVISMLIIPVTFMGNDFFAKQLATLPFMKVNPVYSGGDSARSFTQDSMMITINKPVFASLIGTSKKGFVQVKFAGELPASIQSNIDYNDDSITDFSLHINTVTGDTKLQAMSKQVTDLAVSSKVKDYWVVRVNLLNPDKE